jgi:hypothetical protein
VAFHQELTEHSLEELVASLVVEALAMAMPTERSTGSEVHRWEACPILVPWGRAQTDSSSPKTAMGSSTSFSLMVLATNSRALQTSTMALVLKFKRYFQFRKIIWV